MKYPVITSTQNPRVIGFSKLKDEKYRSAEGLFLCEGVKLTNEALASSSVICLICRADKITDFERLIKFAEEQSADTLVLSEAPFSKVSTEKAPQGVISVCRKPHYDLEANIAGLSIMCCGIRDPGNLGTIIRTASGLGYRNVIIHDCSDVFNPRCVRASMGAVFKINLVFADNAVTMIERLRSNGRRIVATALKSDSGVFGNVPIYSSDVFVIGNEGHGLDDALLEKCDATVCIPLKNGIESFNAAMAAGIIMWEQSKTLD